MDILIFLVVVCSLPFIGWKIGGIIGGFFEYIFGGGDKSTFIDKSVHHHHYNQYHTHEHKHINIIDDATKKSIYELKESKKVK